ncbi:MAG: Glycerophosphodiester phosphodiesterase [Turneriella sp.]|nr:Glycerophosphodiester phosphodiesterase [Turneriella sp.]
MSHKGITIPTSNFSEKITILLDAPILFAKYASMKMHVGVTLFATAIVVACTSTSPQRRLLPKPELQGHRGARGLAPENTWAAFERGLKEGATVLELDTNITKDLKLVIHHNSKLNPIICNTPDGQPVEEQPIRNFTLAELKTLDCGSKRNPDFAEQTPSPHEKLISIEEFFEKFKKTEKENPQYRNILFNIEAKFPDVPDNKDSSSVSKEALDEFATLMAAAVNASGYAQRITVQSFAIEILPLVKAKSPHVRTSALFQPTYWQGFRMYIGLGGGVRDAILQKAIAVKADIISPYWLYCSNDFILKAHENKMLVIPWTVNDTKKIRDLLDRGVDGIISDYPNRLHL